MLRSSLWIAVMFLMSVIPSLMFGSYFGIILVVLAFLLIYSPFAILAYALSRGSQCKILNQTESAKTIMLIANASQSKDFDKAVAQAYEGSWGKTREYLGHFLKKQTALPDDQGYHEFAKEVESIRKAAAYPGKKDSLRGIEEAGALAYYENYGRFVKQANKRAYLVKLFLVSIVIPSLLLHPLISIFLPGLLGPLGTFIIINLILPGILFLLVLPLIRPDYVQDRSPASPPMLFLFVLIAASVGVAAMYRALVQYIDPFAPDMRGYSFGLVLASSMLGLCLALAIIAYSHTRMKKPAKYRGIESMCTMGKLMNQALDVLLYNSRVFFKRLAWFGIGFIFALSVAAINGTVKALVYMQKVLLDLTMGTVTELSLINNSSIVPPAIVALQGSVFVIQAIAILSIASSQLTLHYSETNLWRNLRNNMLIGYTGYMVILLVSYLAIESVLPSIS